MISGRGCTTYVNEGGVDVIRARQGAVTQPHTTELI